MAVLNMGWMPAPHQSPEQQMLMQILPRIYEDFIASASPEAQQKRELAERGMKVQESEWPFRMAEGAENRAVQREGMRQADTHFQETKQQDWQKFIQPSGSAQLAAQADRERLAAEQKTRKMQNPSWFDIATNPNALMGFLGQKAEMDYKRAVTDNIRAQEAERKALTQGTEEYISGKDTPLSRRYVNALLKERMTELRDMQKGLGTLGMIDAVITDAKGNRSYKDPMMQAIVNDINRLQSFLGGPAASTTPVPSTRANALEELALRMMKK